MEVGSHQGMSESIICRSVHLNASIWKILKVAQMCPPMLMISHNSDLAVWHLFERITMLFDGAFYK